MNKKLKQYLLLEQLEERIFLDANPLAAVDPIEPATDPGVKLIPIPSPASISQDSPSSKSEAISESPKQETNSTPSAMGDETPEAAEVNAEKPHEVTANDLQSTPTEEPAEELQLPINENENENESDPTAIQSDETMESSDTGISSSSPLTLISGTESSNEDAVEDTTDSAAGEVIDPMIGEDFTFTVSLDNTTGGTLYGPYIDLYMPTSGDDGDDGVSFVSASYLGTPVNATVQTFVSDTTPITHPYAVDGSGNPITISGSEPLP